MNPLKRRKKKRRRRRRSLRMKLPPVGGRCTQCTKQTSGLESVTRCYSFKIVLYPHVTCLLSRSLCLNNICVFTLLVGKLRRGRHPKLAALQQLRSLGALVSQKLKAGGAPSQRSLRPRGRCLQPRDRQENSQPLRRNPHHHPKRRPSREELLQESPKHPL